MINPLRSEAEAFRFLIASIAYFGAIVIAAVAGGKWAGLGVFVFLSAVVIGWWLRARREERPLQTAPRPHAAGERRILVVANETVGGHTLRSMILEKSLDVREEVLVVTPALNSPLRHWVSDEDQARAAAQERLDASLAKLAEAGVQARGEVGDVGPLQAMEDALRTFSANVLPASSLTVASQICVVRPPWMRRDSARIVPSSAVARKFVFSSIVVKPVAPSGSDAMQP